MELSNEEQILLTTVLCTTKAAICANAGYNAGESNSITARAKVIKFFELETYYVDLAEKVEKNGLKGLSKDELQKLLALYGSPHVLDMAVDAFLHEPVLNAKIGDKNAAELFEIYGKQRKTLRVYVKALKDMDTHAGTEEQQDIANI